MPNAVPPLAKNKPVSSPTNAGPELVTRPKKLVLTPGSVPAAKMKPGPTCENTRAPSAFGDQNTNPNENKTSNRKQDRDRTVFFKAPSVGSV